MIRSPLLWALLIFLALGAALIARVPLGASPDEPAHWQYIEYLATNRALPVFAGQVPDAPGYEFHQPPLYYAVAAGAWAVLPPGFQNYWARLVSLLCGALTLVFIWKSARLFAPDDRSIAILATGLCALWPLHLSVSAGANNDAMGGLWAAALFWIGARALLEGANWRDAVLLGAFVGLGALSKNTVLFVALPALIALLAAPRLSARAPTRIVGVAVALAIMTLIAGPWWARNTFQYGDPLALRLFSRAASAASPGLPQWLAVGGDISIYLRFMAWMIYMTLWGFFGGPNAAITATNPLGANGPVVRDAWLAPLMLTCLLAPLACLLGWWRGGIRALLTPAQKSVVFFWLAGFALIFLAWMQFAYNHLAGGQARYFHTALLPMCLLGALGWRALWPTSRALKIASVAMAATLLAITLLNLFGWRTLT